MNHQIKIEQRDPNEFKPGRFHPALKQIPELPQDSEEFLALAAGVKKCGFIRPLLADEEGRLVDDHSRSLWRVALRWQLATVPVQVVPAAEAHLLVIHSLAHVRHLSKSAIAYLAEPQLQEAIKMAVHNYRQNLAKGQYSPSPLEAATGAPTIEKMAEDLGLSKDTLDRAREVRKLFKLHAEPRDFVVEGGERDGQVVNCTLQEWFEPRILTAFAGGEHEGARPLGLGAVIAAVEGILATKDKARPDKNLSRLFKKLLGGTENQLEFWNNSQSEAIAELERRAAELEPEKCEALAAMHAQMAKIYRDHSKANA